MGVFIKAGFGVLAAVLYGIGALTMLVGASHTAGFSPGDAPIYLVTTCGAGITAFVATQLGIAIASGPSANDQDRARGGFVARLDAYAGAQANANRLTAAVLVFDLVVLVVCGLWFVFLWASPGSIAAPRGTTLSAAPDYVAVQAKAFVALVLAGAAGVGVAATK